MPDFDLREHQLSCCGSLYDGVNNCYQAYSAHLMGVNQTIALQGWP